MLRVSVHNKSLGPYRTVGSQSDSVYAGTVVGSTYPNPDVAEYLNPFGFEHFSRQISNFRAGFRAFGKHEAHIDEFSARIGIYIEFKAALHMPCAGRPPAGRTGSLFRRLGENPTSVRKWLTSLRTRIASVIFFSFLLMQVITALSCLK